MKQGGCISRRHEAPCCFTAPWPEEETGKAKLSLKERQLEEQFALRVADSAREQMLSGLAAGTVCRDFFGGPHRTDGLVVRVRQLCRNGALVWVAFEVENRKRPDVAIESALLTDTRGGASSLARLNKDQLRFNERSAGVAAIAFEGEMKPSTYTLTIVEDGGLSRQVVVDGIEF